MVSLSRVCPVVRRRLGLRAAAPRRCRRSRWGAQGGTTFPSEPRAGGHLSRELVGLRAGTPFPPILQRTGSGCVTLPRWRAARRRRGARRQRRAALAVEAGMDVTGPETDWRSTNFRQKLVSQM